MWPQRQLYNKAVGSASMPACSVALGDTIFSFGKHRGRSFSDVRNCDPGYCSWALCLQNPYGALASFVSFLQTTTNHSMTMSPCPQSMAVGAGQQPIPSNPNAAMPRMWGTCHPPHVLTDVVTPVGRDKWPSSTFRPCYDQFNVLANHHIVVSTGPESPCQTEPDFRSSQVTTMCNWTEGSQQIKTIFDDRLPSTPFSKVRSQCSDAEWKKTNAQRNTNTLQKGATDHDSRVIVKIAGLHTKETSDACEVASSDSREGRVSESAIGGVDLYHSWLPGGVNAVREGNDTLTDQQLVAAYTPLQKASFPNSGANRSRQMTHGFTSSRSTIDRKAMDSVLNEHSDLVSSSKEANSNSHQAMISLLDQSSNARRIPEGPICQSNSTVAFRQEYEQQDECREPPVKKRRRRVAASSSDSEANRIPVVTTARSKVADDGSDSEPSNHIQTHGNTSSSDLEGEEKCASIGNENSEDKKPPAYHADAVLTDISCAAEAALLGCLAGPAETQAGSTSFDTRCSEVRQAIGRGCINLKIDYWGRENALSSLSDSFNALKEHQVVGVRWLLALHKSVPGMVLADEMGLGKTLQVLCFLEILASRRPSLIVAPASLLDNWVAEAAKWTPRLRVLKYHASSGAGRRELQQEYFDHPHKYQLVITTPHAAHAKEDRMHFFRHVEFDCIVVDEAHSLKNSRTARYNDVIRLKCHRRILLTGTPVQNSLDELCNLLGFALAGASAGKNAITQALEAIVMQPQDRALQRLQVVAAPLILRRLKVDVLKSLPAKLGMVVYCEMESNQCRLYEEEVSGSRVKSHKGGAGVKDAYHNLRRICLHPLLGKWRLSESQLSKFCDELTLVRQDFKTVSRARIEKEVRGWNDFEKHQEAARWNLNLEFRATRAEILGSAKISELLKILRRQEVNRDKTLVFSQFTQLLDIIEAALALENIEFIRLDGTTPIEDRQQLASTFQGEGGPLVFLVSVRAGGVGLTLTAANCVVMLDLDFNPQNTRQAEDRVHRLGQSRDVTVHYLVCQGTVEEMVLKRNLAKMQLDKKFGGEFAALELAASEAPLRDNGEEKKLGSECEELVLAELGNMLRCRTGAD